MKELGHRTIKSLLPSDFQAIYAAMIQDGKASSTVHHTHVVAHSILNEAVTWGLIPYTSEQAFCVPTWNSEGWVFPSVHIHSLRHAMATTWLTAGISITVGSEHLGHASIAITLQIYGYLLPNMQATAAPQVEAQFVGRNDQADE